MARPRGKGDGSIYRRADGRWAATVELGMQPGPNGLLVRKRKAVYGATRAEVAAKLRQVQAEIDQGLPVTDDRRTVAAYLAEWLAAATPTLKPRVAQKYEQVVRLHLVPTLGRLPLAKLAPAHVQRLYAAKLASGQAPRSVVHIHRALRRALAVAVEQRILGWNVCDTVKPPRVPKREEQFLTPEQARRLLATIRDDPFEALYLLALTTGIRQGELFALRWSDIDLGARRMAVQRRVERVNGEWRLDAPKTVTSRRPVELMGVMVAALRRHKERQAFARQAAGDRWRDGDLVFPNAVGGFLATNNLTRRSWQPLLRRAGLPLLRFHDLRHSTASLLMALGTHPRIVAELLGHSDTAMTDRYTHVAPGLHRQAIDLLERLLTEPTSADPTADDSQTSAIDPSRSGPIPEGDVGGAEG